MLNRISLLFICLFLTRSVFADTLKCDPLVNRQSGVPNISAQDECKPYSLSLDLLVWTMRETGADNWGQNFSSSTMEEHVEILDIPFKWSPGFRCGINYSLKNYDGWDTKGSYTWFLTQADDKAYSITGLASPFLGNFYINNADGSSVQAVPRYASASMKWKLQFDLLEWELGRKYWVSSNLSLRPFAGIKGGRIYQKVESKWFNPINVTPATTFDEGKEDLKNHFWGIGPSIGIDSTWKMGATSKQIFSLFGDFSGGILWGRWSFKDVYQNDQPQKVSINTSNLTGATSTVRAILGFQWEGLFIPDRFSLNARMGYESQFWLNQLQFYSYNTGRLSNPLTLQGATIDILFNF